MTFAPIALFVYNRPAHTRQTVEALQKNELAGDSDLFVFSDAPKTAAQADAVREVREYIEQIGGFRSVAIIERKSNLGLARSIIDGVTRLCKEQGRVIVLEDDLVTSPYFLRFMNEALDMYEHEERVMHVSGSVYPVGNMGDENFFLRIPLCWGWGTWERAWRHFSKNHDVMQQFDKEMRKEFTFNHTFDVWHQLELNKRGAISTWFVYWYATLFFRKGLALFPGKSLVRNIGMDGSGMHCGADQNYDIEPSTSAINILLVPPQESAEAIRRHESFFRTIMPKPVPLHTRIYSRTVRMVKGLGRHVLKMLGRNEDERRNAEILRTLSRKHPTCQILTTALHDVVLGEYVALIKGAILNSVNIGDFSYISHDSIVNNVEIGKFCSIGHNVQIGLATHPSKVFVSTSPVFFSNNNSSCPMSFRDDKIFDDDVPRTVLGNDIWIGANAIIPGGIHIGTGAIVAAGAVVVKDVPPYAVVGGNPAKIIRHRFTEEQIKLLLESEWWDWPIEKLRQRVDDFSDIEKFQARIG